MSNISKGTPVFVNIKCSTRYRCTQKYTYDLENVLGRTTRIKPSKLLLFDARIFMASLNSTVFVWLWLCLGKF